MGTDSPSWVPGEVEREARERLEEGVTGLYGDLSPGLGSLLEVAATCVAHAFDAYAHGNWELCDALLAEGQGAAGEIFLYLAERVASPSYPYRVDSPHWDSFLAHLAVTVLEPRSRPGVSSAPPMPRPRGETETEFQARLDEMGAAAEARKAAGGSRPAPPPPPVRPPPWERKPELPGLSKPGALSESLRRMGLM